MFYLRTITQHEPPQQTILPEAGIGRKGLKRGLLAICFVLFFTFF